jgi:hypothetical protein
MYVKIEINISFNLSKTLQFLCPDLVKSIYLLIIMCSLFQCRKCSY